MKNSKPYQKMENVVSFAHVNDARSSEKALRALVHIGIVVFVLQLESEICVYEFDPVFFYKTFSNKLETRKISKFRKL